MLKKQKNLIFSKGCPPLSNKPPLRLPRADGNSEKISVFSLAQTSNIKSSSMLVLLSPCKSKKSGVSRYPSDPPHRKDQIFSSFMMFYCDLIFLLQLPMKPHYETVRDAEEEQHNSPNLNHSNREQINRQP